MVPGLISTQSLIQISSYFEIGTRKKLEKMDQVMFKVVSARPGYLQWIFKYLKLWVHQPLNGDEDATDVVRFMGPVIILLKISSLNNYFLGSYANPLLLRD